jgi:MerR family transcriptional regulator, thiopeptide resistance regulator
MPRPTPSDLKVGQLAKRTGLTVRALHHYDEIGLLTPTTRTASGQRLYAAADIARLQKILSLKRLGFGLDDIRDLLASPRAPLVRVLSLHLSQVRAQVAQQQRLCDRLEVVTRALDASQTVEVDHLIEIIQELNMIERHYTPEQLKALAGRRDALGPDGMEKAQQGWADLIADARALITRGLPPDAPEAAAVATRWQALVGAFTGGDPGIKGSLNSLYAAESPEVASRGMVDRGLFDFIAQATQHLPPKT